MQTVQGLNQALADRIANLGIRLGSRAINSTIGRKLIDKGIENISDIFKYGVSKTKIKNCSGCTGL